MPIMICELVTFTKTQLIRTERQWRHFVFDSRFTYVFFCAGIALWPVAFISSTHVRAFLMERLFCFWFGALLVYIASSFLLTTLLMLCRRDWLGFVWMTAWTVGLGWIGCGAIYSAFLEART